MCTHGELDLCRDGVDRVNDIVKGRKIKGVCILRQEKLVTDRHGGVRIDVADTVTRYVGLECSDRTAKCNELTVQIGFADRVVIDESEMPDTCARKRLDRIIMISILLQILQEENGQL